MPATADTLAADMVHAVARGHHLMTGTTARAFDYPNCKRTKPDKPVAGNNQNPVRRSGLWLLLALNQSRPSPGEMVEPGGIEPPTSCVQGRRSPS